MNKNLSYYNCQRKVYKYWKKLFFFGIEMAISNSKILFEMVYNNKKMTDLEYKKILIEELLDSLDNAVITLKDEFNYIPPSYVKKFICKGKQSQYSFCYRNFNKRSTTVYFCEIYMVHIHPEY